MTVSSTIGDRPTSASTKTYKVTNTLTRETVHEVEAASKDDLELAVTTCHSAFASWSRTPLQARCDVLRKASSLLQDSSTGWKDRMRSTNLAETSVPPWFAAQQVEEIHQFIDALVDSAPEALAEWTVPGEASTTYMSREPYGVCLAMAAWNAVVMLTARAILTPLIVGNTVILKTSEIAPLSQRLWAELLYAAGLPQDALVVVHIAPEDAPTLTAVLVKHPLVRHVNFTGSTRVGSILAGMAGQSLKPSTMELGGKAPVLLLPDADIDTAASHIIFGTMMNAGQICMSTERILVAASRYDDLRRALQTAWEVVKARDSRALFTDASSNRIHDLVDDALGKGIKPILADDEKQSDRHTVRPQIYGPATPDMRIFAEETFGPVSVIIKVDDKDRSEEQLVDEMVSIANASDYGLSASVWSRDTAKARAVASRLESGAVHVNSPTPHDLPCVPHGGWKSSGWGRFNGIEGIRNFSQTRSVEVPNETSKPMPLHVFGLL